MTRRTIRATAEHPAGVEATAKDIGAEARPADAPKTAPAQKAPAKTEFHVHNSLGTFIRTYTVEIHGEKAGALASEYAGKIGGSVR